MDYEKKYKDALQAAKHALDCEKQGLVTTDRVLIERMFPELKESEDEKIRKDIIVLVKDWWDRVNKDNISTKEQMIAWLEKQKEIDKEIVFRPLAGTDIIAAARQALEKIEIGKEIILAFNGAYIHVNGKTVAEICNEYFAWTEKQGEHQPPWSEEDERLRYSCIKHIEEELEEIGKDKFGHSEIISDLKESCRERIDWLKSLKERLS